MYVTRLITSLLELRPKARAIFLYLRLCPFTSGLWLARGFGRAAGPGNCWCASLKMAFPGLVSPKRIISNSTDLEAAAVGWLAQMVQFVELAKRHPQRIAMLESETFLGHPEEAAIAAFGHFQVGVAAPTVALVVKERIGLELEGM